MRTEIEERLSDDQKAYLWRAFGQHPPPDIPIVDMHQSIRQACKSAAATITFLPPTAERRMALEKVEEAMFWAQSCLRREQDAIIANLEKQTHEQES